ncbi:hypothetical protein B0H15DRAFT_869398 [Mycena belliarum]|uniref:DUF159-domain-containing protein n=1 Tax=Mycena belliarum TaxID=1033014 RepID=A0AAD6TQB5_9AGAR|nr:hypothetical protein B0H15DRAFT_869398 [Mycena belliae]
MCGRFSLRLNPEEIQQLDGYDASVGEWERRDVFIPRFNIAPHTQAPVLRRRDPANVELVMSSMKWGLIPHYSKFEDKTLNTTNARSENLVEGGGMWASLKGPKRCAVVCQGYYEWLTKGKNKLPHFVKPKDGRLMLMAGLYDCVLLHGETEPLWTFTIVTTAANKEFSWLHDRQPVILSTSEALNLWLDTSSRTWNQELDKLVAPTSCALECYQVPKEVGKVGTESPAFIEPVANRKDGIQAMFSKQKQAQALSTPKKAVPKRSFSPSNVDDTEGLDGPSAPKKLKSTPEKKAYTPQPSSSKITMFFNKP